MLGHVHLQEKRGEGFDRRSQSKVNRNQSADERCGLAEMPTNWIAAAQCEPTAQIDRRRQQQRSGQPRLSGQEENHGVEDGDRIDDGMVDATDRDLFQRRLRRLGAGGT